MTVLYFLIYDFGWALFCMLVAIVFILLSIKSTLKHAKNTFLIITGIALAFLLFEIYGQISKNKVKTKFEGTYADNPAFSGYKPHLGFGPIIDSSFSVTAKRYNNDSLIYKVVYSIKRGERIVLHNNECADHSVWFLGCSHIFGDGLNDNETLPYFFNKQSQKSYNVRNLGFSGYGTHQALKILETKLVASTDTIKCIIYSFFDDHFLRASGKMLWNVHDPCYEVQNNKLVYKGSFNENRFFTSNPITKRLRSIWHKSAIYSRILQEHITCKDIQRVALMMDRMNNLASQKNTRFIVLVRSSNLSKNLRNQFYNSFAENNIEHYFIDSIIPDLHIGNYRIKGDGHPNAMYNYEVGLFLNKIIQE